jgi:hypothetical protein
MDGRSYLRPRVLIVEPDRDLALGVIQACLDSGLEPKICLGADWNTTECPGLRGEPCPRTGGVEATLLSITTPEAQRAFPSCVGGRLVLSGDRKVLDEIAGKGPAPDARLLYPYEPDAAAETLLQLVRDERKQELWDHIRSD